MKITKVTVGGFAANCYILEDKASGRAAIIDQGNCPAKILSLAGGAKVEYLLLTHAHFDHFGAILELREQTGAKVAMHRAAAEAINDPRRNVSSLFGRSYPQIETDVRLEDGDTLQLGALTLRVLHTPGHTAGCCCYLCGDVLFTGDTLLRGTVGRTDFADGDYATLCTSLRRLSALAGDYTVLPGHGERTTLDRERMQNPFFYSE